jgi:hypothetical protein
MKFVLSLSMLAALPLVAIAAPLERSSEAVSQDVGKRQAACGGAVQHLSLGISSDDKKKSADSNAMSRTIRAAAVCA